MVWMSAISLAIFTWLCFSIVRQNWHDPFAVFGLILKILAGLALGLLYKYHYNGGDTFLYYRESGTIAHYFMDHPSQALKIFIQTLEIPELKDILVFHDQPRALLFSKIVSVFYFFSGGNYWIISAYLSLINYLCIHFLIAELGKKFKRLKKASSISFYFLPTFVFWTSGLLKESLAIGALAIAVALAVRFTRTREYAYFPYWFYLFLSSVVLWELKYYYAAIAIPLILALLLFDILSEWKKFHPGFILIIFLAGIIIVSTLHYNLGFSRVLNVVYENYQLSLNSSDSASIQYYNFDGSRYGFFINLPLAFFSGLFRPVIFDVSNPLQFLVALENIAAFILVIFTLWKSGFRFSIINPFLIVTLIYVFSLAVLLAFAAPNFGTLSRYKAGYWPFFVLLVLSLYFLKQKNQTR